MPDAIEAILSADEAAREQGAAAGSEAEQIRSGAQQSARETLAAKLCELNAAAAAEHGDILAEAGSKASRITSEADRTIEVLQAKKDAILKDLLENLLKKVTGL
jgi:vacuolar-type H+-ATPase subunit H